MKTQVLKAGSRPPWVGVAAAVWVEFAAGTAYTFPLYSSALKSVLGLSQQQLTLLGVANDFGENVGILPGLACNKFPPWVVLAIGAVCCFMGFGVLWLAVSQTVLNMPYWLLFMALVVGCNSSAWFGTAVLVTNMRNFPLSRGTVAGLLKGYVAISAAMFTELYSMVLNGSAPNLLLFITVGLPFIAFAVMYFIRPCTPASGEDSSEHGHFLFAQGTSILLGIFLLTTIILAETISLNKVICYTFIGIMVLFMFSPLAIPIKMTIFPKTKRTFGQQSDSSNQLALGFESDQADPLLKPSPSDTNLSQEVDDTSDVEILLALGEGAVRKKRRPRRGDDFEILEAFVKADFWLIWFVYFVGVGTGVTVLNNLAQIGYAQGVSDTTVLLSLFGFCNFLGRISGGGVSEYFVRTRTIPRTVWMTFTQIIMIGIFLLYASALSGTLYAATALIGICYGFQFSIMIPTVSELFGLKHFGVFYNFMLLGNPAGALIFSGWLAGYVYDLEAAEQGVSTCVGASCFRLTFLILSGVCGLGTLFSILLTYRIKPVYQMLYAGGSFSRPPSQTTLE